MTCTPCPTTLGTRWEDTTRPFAGTRRWGSGSATTTPGEPHLARRCRWTVGTVCVIGMSRVCPQGQSRVLQQSSQQQRLRAFLPAPVVTVHIPDVSTLGGAERPPVDQLTLTPSSRTGDSEMLSSQMLSSIFLQMYLWTEKLPVRLQLQMDANSNEC